MKNMKKNKKSGFTLVELMVVAIIVAILAAVAIPMMTNNTDDAVASEGRTGCGAVATQIRMHFVENGSAPANFAALTGISASDLLGSYFDTYTISVTDQNNYTVTAAGRSGSKAAGQSVVMSVANGVTTWQGMGGEAIPE